MNNFLFLITLKIFKALQNCFALLLSTLNILEEQNICNNQEVDFSFKWNARDLLLNAKRKLAITILLTDLQRSTTRD